MVFVMFGYNYYSIYYNNTVLVMLFDRLENAEKYL